MRGGEAWRRAGEEPRHPLAALDGADLGGGAVLELRLGPRSKVGSASFRCYLDGPEGRTAGPLLSGLHNAGRFPGFNWVEVSDWTDAPPLEGGGALAVTPALERAVFGALARLVPAGGHFMAEYASPARALTARALAARVPPVATPLGALLHGLGCGVAFRDWYISEGGREGPRKLQGFRALDEAHARARGLETAAALDAFLAERGGGLARGVRESALPLAEAARAELRRRYGAA